MRSAFRKRMVCFRLTEQEYGELERACYAEGSHTISEFARMAVLRPLERSIEGASVGQTLRRIERNLQTLRDELS